MIAAGSAADGPSASSPSTRTRRAGAGTAAAEGPAAVTVTTQTVSIDDDCEMDLSLYTPEGGGPLLILAHGFARSQVNMAGWASHLASWGVTVATPDLCHSSFTDADHAANADELRALSDAIGRERVVAARSHRPREPRVGRSAVLAAGWPEEVPATTIDRQCGSSQQATNATPVFDIIIPAPPNSTGALPVLVSRLYGPRRFAAVYGQVFTAWGTGGILAPWLAGRLLDLTGGYNAALVISSGALLVSGLVAIALPREPERGGV